MEQIEPKYLHLGVRDPLAYYSYNPLKLSGNRVIFTIGESDNKRISDSDFDANLRSFVKKYEL